jgi:hypothetical protein
MLTTYGQLRQPSFFDGLIHSALQSNALLAKVDRVLTDMPNLLDPLIARYAADRQEREVDTTTGRPTIRMEVLLRSLLLKHLHRNCGYREVEERLTTDYAWKGFAHLSLVDRVPDHNTLHAWEAFFGEATVTGVHDRIIAHLTERPIVKGRRLRGRKLQTDTTVTEANVHYPTDTSLLGDAVRTITRIVQRIRTRTRIRTTFRNRTRTVRRILYTVARIAKRRMGTAKEDIAKVNRTLMTIATDVAAQGRAVARALRRSTDRTVRRIRPHLQRILTTTASLVEQTASVLDGHRPPERIVSVHQPWVRPIPKGKLGKPCEFGKKLEVVEIEHGIIADWRLSRGNPNDATLLCPTVDRHRKRFGRDPTHVATDRGFWSTENDQSLARHGDGTVRIPNVSIPCRGKKTEERREIERSSAFRRLQRWRAGGEATISHCKRSFGIGKSRAHREDTFDAGVGWGIVARNMTTIGRLARIG